MVCWDHVRRSAAQYNATLVELSRKWQVRYHRGRLSLCCIAQWNYKLHCIAQWNYKLHCIKQWNYELHCTVELCCTALHSGTIYHITLHCTVEVYIALHCIEMHSGSIHYIALHCIVNNKCR